jgi:hypothetical protein
MSGKNVIFTSLFRKMDGLQNRPEDLDKKEIPALDGNQITVAQPQSVRLFQLKKVMATK